MHSMESIRRLAIVYPKAIGDFFFALPALHTLRRAFAQAHITWVVKQKQAPLAEPQKGLVADEVLVIGGGTSPWEVRRKLKALRVDTMVDLAGNDQAGLILSGRRGRRFRPHRADCKGLCALYTPWATAMPRLAAGLHRVDELLAFARFLGAPDPVLSFRIALPEQAVEECEALVARHDLRSGVVVAINLGASRDTKRWPAEHIQTLAQDLIARGYRVALTGAQAFAADGDYDRRTIERFTAAGLIDGERCLDLVTATGLSPALHLQRDAHFLRYSGVPAVVVGCDTGPMHMAGSVGEDARNRTISLFGPTNWGRYAPYDPSRHFPDQPAGQWNRVLGVDEPCGPRGTREACRCYRRGCAPKSCMRGLTPERVLAAVTAMAPRP
jgi:ADP-heptose:LPS heptosyltransferase